MTLPSSSTLNLKVTVGSSVLTQSINTNSVANKTKLAPSLTIDPKLIMASKEIAKTDQNLTNTTYITTSSDQKFVSTSFTTNSVVSKASSENRSSILTFNVETLPKDFLSSAILKVDADFDKATSEEAENDLENNDDQSMEIDEGEFMYTLFIISQYGSYFLLLCCKLGYIIMTYMKIKF